MLINTSKMGVFKMLSRQILILAAVCTASAVCSAADFPARKPGLWQITMNHSNAKLPPQVEKVCLDKATDELLYKVGAGVSSKVCSKVDIHTSGGQVVVDSICNLGSSKVTGHSVTTMNGDAAYHTDVTTHYDPPLFGKSDSSQTHDAHWLGACPADMRPGDISVEPSAQMPAPIKMNLNDMFKGAAQ
jgi:hypothetical protein